MQFHRNMGMCWLNKGMIDRIQIEPLSAGFEPARGNPIGFRVQRLNLSAITAPLVKKYGIFWKNIPDNKSFNREVSKHTVQDQF